MRGRMICPSGLFAEANPAGTGSFSRIEPIQMNRPEEAFIPRKRRQGRS